MASPSLASLILSLAVAIVAFVFAYRGWRWRRESIPPTCRACGYDVSQRPAGVERCSECGADLAGARAIVTSRRVVNRPLAIPATLVSVVVLLRLASLVAQFPWVSFARQYAPISWIQALARRNYGVTGDPYRVEWQRREGVTPAFLDSLLDVQGDASVPWRTTLDGLLTRALTQGAMTDAQQGRYVRQLFVAPTIRVRTPVRVGDPLPIEVRSTLRGSPDASDYETLAAHADGDATILDHYWSLEPIQYASSRWTAMADWTRLAIAPGTHHVTVRLRRQLANGQDAPPHPRDLIGPPVEDSVSLDVDVLPPGAPIGTPIAAPDQADAIARAIAVRAYRDPDGRCFAAIELFPAPVDRAFTLVAVIDGIDQKIGGVCAKADENGTTGSNYVPLSTAQATAKRTLTIALVGDNVPLAQTIDQRKYWPGRITFVDVPIRTFDDDQKDAVRTTPTTLPYRVERDARRHTPALLLRSP